MFWSACKAAFCYSKNTQLLSLMAMKFPWWTDYLQAHLHSWYLSTKFNFATKQLKLWFISRHEKITQLHNENKGVELHTVCKKIVGIHSENFSIATTNAVTNIRSHANLSKCKRGEFMQSGILLFKEGSITVTSDMAVISVFILHNLLTPTTIYKYKYKYKYKYIINAMGIIFLIVLW